jgi:RHS repeat-associated protein
MGTRFTPRFKRHAPPFCGSAETQRPRAKRHNTLAALLCVFVAFIGAVTGGSSAAAATVASTTPVVAKPPQTPPRTLATRHAPPGPLRAGRWLSAAYLDLHLAAVVCPSATVCEAVGFYADPKGNQEGLIESLSGATWIPTRAPLPAGAGSSPSAELNAISCSSVSACVAVGSYLDASGYQTGMIDTLSGGSWSSTEAILPAGGAHKPPPSAGLEAVACSSANACVTVGEYTDQSSQQEGLIETLSGGAWNATKAPLPTGVGASTPVNLLAVACPSAGACFAVGHYSDQNFYSQGVIETLSGGTWTPTQSPLPSGGNGANLLAILCLAANSCLAAGSYGDASANGQGLLEAQAGGIWGATEAPLPADANSDPYATLLAVACASPGACLAVGDYVGSNSHGVNLQEGLIEAQSGGTWLPAEAPIPSGAYFDPNIQLSATACPSVGACVAVGSYWDQNVNSQGLIETQSGGTWNAIEAPVPSGAGTGGYDRGLASTACLSSSGCVSVGRYYDATPASQGLIETQSGGGWTPAEAPAPGGSQQPLIGGPVTVAELLGGSNCGCANSNLGQSYAGDPVDTAFGNFTEPYTDISIPGRGIPLRFSRTYNSLAATSLGPLGYGWMMNGLMSLTPPVGSGPVTITQEGGAQIVFTQNGSTYVPAEPRIIASLAHIGSNWILIRRAQNTATFSATGQLLSEKDNNGYTTSFAYNGGNQLTTMTDPAGRTLTLGWTGANITSVTDANVSPARTVSYQYNDGNGNLTDVTDVNGGHTHLKYDAGHHLTNLFDPNCYAAGSGCNGGNGVVNNYDGQSRVGSQQDQLGRQTTFVYVGDPSSASGGTTTITDPKGNVTVDQYQYGVLTAETKGNGAASWEYTYDPGIATLASAIDPNGNTTLYTYDNNGNQLSKTDQLGRQTNATYNSLNEPLTQTDGLNVTTTYAYDVSGKGNLTSVTRSLLDAGGHVIATPTVQYNYNDTFLGDVTSIVDPDLKTTTLNYDAFGDLASSIDPLAHATSHTYNNDGWPLTDVSAKGNVSGCGCAAQYTTTYSYVVPGVGTTDEWGDVQTVTDPLGHTVTDGYDGDRNRTTFTDGVGNTTTYVYDLANEQTHVKRADSPQTTVTTDYNADGTVLDRKDGKGAATQTFGYNTLAQPTSVRDALNYETDYTYDGVGNQVSKQDPGGSCASASRCTTNAYNNADELTSITYSDGVTPNVSAITYDADGQKRSWADGTGVWTQIFDSLHRLTSVTEGSNGTVAYTYNLRNLPITITYPGSGHVVTETYDNAGRWTKVQDWNGNATTISYDVNSNLTKYTLPSATTVVDTQVYNAADQLNSNTDTAGTSTFFTASYTRDANNQVATDSSAPANQTKVRYTPLNQICYAGSVRSSACASPPTGAEPFAYDAADNLVGFNGTTQQFNAADQLCWTVAGASSNPCTTQPATGATLYGYDTRGNRLSQTPPSGVSKCDGYDEANRVTTIVNGTGSSCTSPTAVASYVYNAAGLRTSKTVSGVTTSAIWDLHGGLPLLLEDKTTSSATDYVYGPGGLPLEQISSTDTFWYHHDQLGSTRAIRNTSGTAQATYQYDPYGNIVSCTGTTVTVGLINMCSGAVLVANAFTYAGQYRDNESNVIYLRARYYDPTTAQFLTRDPLVTLTGSPYAYVGGSPLNLTDSAGLAIDPSQPNCDNPQDCQIGLQLYYLDSFRKGMIRRTQGAERQLQSAEAWYLYDLHQPCVSSTVISNDAGAILSASDALQQDMLLLSEVVRVENALGNFAAKVGYDGSRDHLAPIKGAAAGIAACQVGLAGVPYEVRGAISAVCAMGGAISSTAFGG